MLLLALPASGAERGATLQLFGDTWLPQHVLDKTETTAESPRLFEGVRALLDGADLNVVNFEGAATDAAEAALSKRWLLRMPKDSPALLKAVGVEVATLANNHAMDYGEEGLFDTLRSMKDAGVATLGAGRTLEEAAKPLVKTVGGQTICLFAYTRTLPQSFWATATKAGTAHVVDQEMAKDVRDCAERADFTVVTFHWGTELSSKPSAYQSELARTAIAAGADLVVGHHPHVLQDIEVIDGKPVFHSIGNFAFGSLPIGSRAEGMAVRVRLPEKTYELWPLAVNNEVVTFKPRPLEDKEADPIAPRLPKGHGCKWSATDRYWTCRFSGAAGS